MRSNKQLKELGITHYCDECEMEYCNGCEEVCDVDYVETTLKKLKIWNVDEILEKKRNR